MKSVELYTKGRDVTANVNLLVGLNIYHILKYIFTSAKEAE